MRVLVLRFNIFLFWRSFCVVSVFDMGILVTRFFRLLVRESSYKLLWSVRFLLRISLLVRGDV